MPALTLAVCIHNERDLLERLLQKAEGCYDELVVVHDGPDLTGVKAVAARFHGRFFEPPRRGSLEGQSPFGWAQASHDWIFRPDADEFPGEEMKQWLRRFREAPEPGAEVSGYTCVWPLWNGKRAVSTNWPAGRIFLFHRQRVRFFGLVEQTPIPDFRYEPQPLVLHHQPRRRSYGLGNALLRKQAYAWRNLIARGLLGKPTDLPCWRWESESWPENWERVRRHPLRTALWHLAIENLRAIRNQWRADKRIYPAAAFNGAAHHALSCLAFWRLRRQRWRRAHVERRPAND